MRVPAVRHAVACIIAAGAWCGGFGARAEAATERLAIVVGNNYAVGEKVVLRFAEDDAAKVAGVLRDLGGVPPEDLSLLRGLGAADLRRALERVRQKVLAHGTAIDRRTMLIFFFSGHSDGESLELGADHLSFHELLGLLAATGADVRVAIVDSCRSGALLAAKGSQPGPAFDIRLSSDRPAKGTVLLTSSTSTERALESEEIRGSFFTHHFVSGLRGAADVSGDGRVTLAEAYQYAYERTVSATAETLVGAQHPEYDYRLTGAGDIVLTELTAPSANLILPAGFDRALIFDARKQVVAEVPASAAARLSLREGIYDIRLWRQGRVFAGGVTLGPGETRRPDWTLFAAASSTSAVGKGATDEPPEVMLKRAIQLFEALKDEEAATLLNALLGRPTPAATAAKAHLYLGLIQLNATHADAARDEFKQMLLADPTLELPGWVSPKTVLAFKEARRELNREVDAQPAGPGAKPAPSPAPQVPAEATQVPRADPSVKSISSPQPARSHALAFALGAAGVAMGALAVVGGVEVLSYDGMVNPATPNKYNASQVGPAYATAQVFGVVWPIAAVLAAAGLAGAVLTW